MRNKTITVFVDVVTISYMRKIVSILEKEGLKFTGSVLVKNGRNIFFKKL